MILSEIELKQGQVFKGVDSCQGRAEINLP
jgi:hypothetical protein